MRVVVGGASGFLGQALVTSLRDSGHTVTRLVRQDDIADDASPWDPSSGEVDKDLIAGADAVVNLSGAPIARWPWTKSYRNELVESRINATHTLATAIADTGGTAVFLSGSGHSYYGNDRGEEVLTEGAGAGNGVLADVSQAWEEATGPARNAGARVCLLRTSLVMHRDGGVLQRLIPLFKLGGGGKLGKGQQYFATVSRADWIGAVEHLLTHDSAEGPFNISSPETATNAEFTKALSRQLHRPAVMHVPGPVIRRVLGGGLGEELTGSLRTVPHQLLEHGYTFQHTNITETLTAALND